MRMAKTKTLISFGVTVKLTCVFVFTYAKSQFSHDEVHICMCQTSGGNFTFTARLRAGIEIDSIINHHISI